MSDLQDLIATNAVKAYNQGFERGEASERERIIKLLEDSEVRAKWIEATSKSLPTYQGVVDFFTSLIKGEQK